MIQIKIYPEITAEVKEIFPKFIKENFDTVDFEDPEVAAETAEYYWKPAEVHLIVYEGDEVVGVCHLTKRVSKFLDNEIIIAAIGGLVVSKNHRKQGIASELIKKSFEVATEWNSDIAFLNTDIEKLGEFFGKFGFLPLKNLYSFIGKSGKLHEEDDGMIAPVNSKEVFDMVLNSQEALYIGEGNL